MPPPSHPTTTLLSVRAATLRHLCASALALGLAACGGGQGEPDALLATTALASAAHSVPPGCTPTPPSGIPSGPGPYTLCWGDVGWYEPTLQGAALQQNLDFYPATPTAGPAAPLIVWAHPNGLSKTLPTGSPMREALLPPALGAGYAFASLEFRHPVTNAPQAPDSPVPHTDIAQALNYLVANAAALGIDPRNIFLVGQSRGTLGVWTAMQPETIAPAVRAVFAVNAQTSYRGEDFAQWFLVEPDRAPFVREFYRQNPNAPAYGSAVRDVTRQAPPIHLRYDTPVVDHLLTLEQMAQQNALHYPNFGPVLCAAYTAAGASAPCHYEADTRFHDRPDLAYEGYVRFFDRYYTP